MWWKGTSASVSSLLRKQPETSWKVKKAPGVSWRPEMREGRWEKSHWSGRHEKHSKQATVIMCVLGGGFRSWKVFGVQVFHIFSLGFPHRNLRNTPVFAVSLSFTSAPWREDSSSMSLLNCGCPASFSISCHCFFRGTLRKTRVGKEVGVHVWVVDSLVKWRHVPTEPNFQLDSRAI